MSILLIAEHDNTNLKVFTLNTIHAASKIDSDIHVLVAGNKCENVSKEVAAVPLVKKVLQSVSPNYENYLPENLAPLVVKLSESYTHIIASANTFGKNFMPRVAALLDTSQISDIIKINSSEKGKKIKRFAAKRGKLCPGSLCNHIKFAQLTTRNIAFGHIISQKWTQTFNFLLEKRDHPDNLYLSCQKCNSSLSDNFPDAELRNEIVTRGTIGDWLRESEKTIRNS